MKWLDAGLLTGRSASKYRRAVQPYLSKQIEAGVYLELTNSNCRTLKNPERRA